MATWAAGSYWTDWHGFTSLNEMVKDYLQKSAYLPIYQNTDLEGTQPAGPMPESTLPGPSIQGDCLARRDILYSEWAAFIDFLMRQFGMEKLEALFKSSRAEKINTDTIIYPPDYQGIYGSALNQLEAEWLTIIQ